MEPFDSDNKRFLIGLTYLFALLALFGIAPFVIIRFMGHEYLRAAIDFAIVLCTSINALIAYKTKQINPIGLLINVIVYTGGAIAVILLNKYFLVFWAFPVIMANFFLLSSRVAVAINLILIVACTIALLQSTSPLITASTVSALLMGTCMAFIFAHLTNQQAERLRLFALQDPLTQLGNRRALDEEMRLCHEDFQRHKTPATLIVFDLDDFKKVNDQFGHNAGDEILVGVSNLLKSRLRKTDRVFRFGGEEFILLARNTSLEESQHISEQIRSQIALEVSDPTGRTITASFGCAQLQDQETREHWFNRADSAMYLAKVQGKNRVALSSKTSA